MTLSVLGAVCPSHTQLVSVGMWLMLRCGYIFFLFSCADVLVDDLYQRGFCTRHCISIEYQAILGMFEEGMFVFVSVCVCACVCACVYVTICVIQERSNDISSDYRLSVNAWSVCL